MARTGTTPASSDADGHLGLAAAADRLGVHYMTAYRYLRTGVLEGEQVDGQWRVRIEAIEDLLVQRTQRAERPPRVGTTHRARPSGPRRVAAMADRLVAGDQSGAWRVVESALVAGSAPSDVYLQVLTPALREIGDRWAAGQATIADEHRASVVAMRLVGRLGALSTRPGRTRGSIVLAAAPGDRHGLPTAILADRARSDGWGVSDLGADTPTEALVAAALGQDRLVAVGLCATTPLGRAARQRLTDAIRAVQDAAQRPVLVGGAAIGSESEAHRLGADAWSHDADGALGWFGRLPPSTRRARP